MAVVDISNTFQMSNIGEHIDNTDVYNSNRNLLDNPFFTVNQRGFTSVTDGNGAPLVDRWKAYRATVVLNTDNSMTVTPTSAQYGISQFIEASRLKVGQTYTMSALVNGEILSASFVYSTTPASSYFATFPNGIRFYRHYANGVVDFWVIRQTTEAFVVQAVKLELGSYSTLANDVPPDYGEELRKCQRYFIRLKNSGWTIFGSGYASSATNLRVLIPLPVTMRATQTRSYSGSFEVIGNGSNALSVTNMTAGFVTANGLEIGVTTSGMTLYQTYHLVSQDTTAYIDLSADL